MKRASDIVLAIALAPVFIPLIIAIWIALSVTSGRPIFAHKRIGKGGKLFNCYKFRTMVPDVERV